MGVGGRTKRGILTVLGQPAKTSERDETRRRDFIARGRGESKSVLSYISPPQRSMISKTRKYSSRRTKFHSAPVLAINYFNFLCLGFDAKSCFKHYNCVKNYILVLYTSF